MKKVLLYLICMCLSFAAEATDMHLKDSLQKRLIRTSDSQDKLDILINLYDLSESTPDELPYAYRLYEEALSAKDAFALTVPLGAIISHLLEIEREDSVDYFLDKAEKVLHETPYDGITDYYRMVRHARILQTISRDKRAEVCEQYNKELEERKKNETPFRQVERLFLSGVITYQLMALTEKTDWSKGIPYWKEAWEIVQSFPPLPRKNFSANLCVCLLSSYLYTKDNAKVIDIANTYLSTLDEYYNQAEVKKRRPYINKDVPYAICYQQLILNENAIGKEKAHEYYLRYCDFMNKKLGDALLRNKTFFYDISCKHFLKRKEYENALAYKDSLILLIEKGNGLAAAKTEHYKDRANILYRWGKYKEASETYAKAINLKDSLIEKEYMGKVSEMRVKHDVDKLELDNLTLLAEKRKNTLYFLFILIVIAIAISVYLYLNLRKVKHLQKELIRESTRAQQSENMKTAFINSMCHEVRTPLNAICGFSELITDPTVDEEEKSSFPDIIRENTQILLALMNDLLEVANLDSTSDIFPLEDINVTAICRTEMERLQKSAGKPGITYQLSLPEKEVYMHTNSKYFALLIRSLLDNANKFTEKGSILLECSRVSEKEITFSIIDTGCGIPKEKYDYIFERFSKLDAFSQGTGLGLYICKIIVERMKGKMYIDPTYTNGAKFIVTVPAK